MCTNCDTCLDCTHNTMVCTYCCTLLYNVYIAIGWQSGNYLYIQRMPGSGIVSVVNCLLCDVKVELCPVLSPTVRSPASIALLMQPQEYATQRMFNFFTVSFDEVHMCVCNCLVYVLYITLLFYAVHNTLIVPFTPH